MADEVEAGTVVVTIDQQDMRFTQEQLGITMETPDRQVLDAVKGMVGEERQGGLQDQAGQYTFAVRRALNSNTIYVYPKPGFGEIEGFESVIVRRNRIGHFYLLVNEESLIDQQLAERGCNAADVVSVTWNGKGYTVWHRR